MIDKGRIFMYLNIKCYAYSKSLPELIPRRVFVSGTHLEGQGRVPKGSHARKPDIASRQRQSDVWLFLLYILGKFHCFLCFVYLEIDKIIDFMHLNVSRWIKKRGGRVIG